MRNKKTMKVIAVDGKMQPNYEAFEARNGVRRFVGRRFDPQAGEIDAKGIAQGGFVILPQGEMVPARPEYIKAVKRGDLLAGDEDTARLCGIAFFNLDE